MKIVINIVILIMRQKISKAHRHVHTKTSTYTHQVVQNSNIPHINLEMNSVNKGKNEISIIIKKTHKVTIFKVEQQ